MEHSSNTPLLKRVAINLGLAEAPSEVRSELPVVGSSILPPPRMTSDTVVTADRALSIAAVYRAVSIVSISVSQLPVGVWRAGAEIDTPALVKQPNVNTSRSVFLEQTANSLALTGNAFWRLHRQAATSPVVNIEVLNPNLMVVNVDNNGRVTYNYNTNGKTVVFQPWQIKHLQLMRVPGSMVGVGPIQAAQNELRGAIDLRDYADNWFRESGIPNGVLKTDQVLTPDMADAYKARWEQTQATRGTAVIGNGLSYQPVYLAPKDAQFLESQEFSITQIARMFGIPASYLLADAGNSMTYTNQESMDTAFVKYTLMAYLSEIEEALTDVLPRGQEAKFKVESLLRADTNTRYTSYKTALEAGFLTVDEVRAREGLLPLPAGAKPAAPVAQANTNNNGGNA